MLWTAVVFFFLIGAAALAIDTSGAFGSARDNQATADLACLAGVEELPDETDAFTTAALYVDANWDGMTSPTLTISGTTAAYTDGSGNGVLMDAAYGVTGDAMFVQITEQTDTAFGGAIGQNEITVTQVAVCSAQSVKDGLGLLPIGALAGPWGGDLFDCATKLTGNCGAVAPDSPGANAYRDAVANGIDGSFLKHHGDEDQPDDDTNFAGIECLATPCNITETETGNMVGPWNQGLQLRFTDSGTCREDGWFNCDSIDAVFGAHLSPTLPVSEPLWWDVSLYGPYGDAQTDTSADHYYYNGNTMLCLHDRIATVPIINQDLDWELGDAEGTWPNGRKDMKMIGFYTIYIREPSSIADIGGPMDADIIWFGPESSCADTKEAFRPFGSTVELDLGVRLVSR